MKDIYESYGARGWVLLSSSSSAVEEGDQAFYIMFFINWSFYIVFLTIRYKSTRKQTFVDKKEGSLAIL